MTFQPYNKFNENTVFFLKNLEQVTNHKIYFFGSSRRFDYINGCDIDIAMFTENIPSLISKIIAFLNIKNDFKEIIHIQKNILINGYKLNYINTNEDINIELVIYDKKYKNIMLDFYEKSCNLPFIISIILLCLKYLNIYGLLDRKIYYKIKIFIFNNFYYSSKLVVIN
jgi:hypothetical protein